MRTAQIVLPIIRAVVVALATIVVYRRAHAIAISKWGEVISLAGRMALEESEEK